MKITDRLKVEHGVFLRQLRFIDELLERDAPMAVLAAAVETIAKVEEHGHVRGLVGAIRAGNFDAEHVREAVENREA